MNHADTAQPMQHCVSSVYTRYYALNAAFNFARALYISTYSLFLVERLSIPLAWTVWILIADLVFSTISELPTGAFADARGREVSFIIGCVLSMVGYAIYAALGMKPPSLAITIFLAILGESILAVGLSFYSGALDAWVIDHPLNPGTLSIQALLSQAQAIKNVFYIFGGVLGVIIFTSVPSGWFSPFFAAALVSGLLIWMAFAFMRDGDKERQSRKVPSLGVLLQEVATQIQLGVRSASLDPRLRLLVICSCFSIILLQVVVVYWPLYVSGLPKGEESPRSLAFVLSISWVMTYASRALGSWMSGLQSAGTHPLASVICAVLASSIPVITLSILPLFSTALPPGYLLATAIVLYSAMRCGEGAVEPLRMTFVNSMISSEYRATVLSAVRALALLATSFLLVLISGALSIGFGLAAIWAATALVNSFSVFLYRKALKPG